MSFCGEGEFIRRVELLVVIAGGDSQLECVSPGFDAVQSSFLALKHSHHHAIDISVNMRAALAFGELELKRNLVASDDLAIFGRDDLDAGSFRRL